MKRWLLAVAALLGAAVSVSYADYIIIQYNLSAQDNPNPMGAGGMPPGFPGGSGGGSGGGAPGSGGGGAPGSGGGGAPGSGGMAPGSGGGSSMPGGGGFMGQPGQIAPEDIPLTPVSVLAVVETKNSPNYAQMQMGLPVRIDHKWGTTYLQLTQNKAIRFTPLVARGKPMPSVAKRFEGRWNAVHNNKPSSDQLVDLADWALSHGLLVSFAKVMDELVEQDKDNRVAVAYTKIKADLDRPAVENNDVGTWKSKLGMDNYKVAQHDKGHYTLLHSGIGASPAEIDARVTVLDNTFQSFYYWFALQGLPVKDLPPVPPQRLLAIVVGQGREFDRVHQIFDDVPLVADGFYARRDNLAIFSNTRLDEAYKNLAAYVAPALANTDTGTVLKGRGSPDLQTAVLMLKALDQDGTVASTTHEVPRQLLAATGLLPRNVEVPQWIRFGMGSFFETCESSPWPSLAAPGTALEPQNNYLQSYLVWSKGKKLDEPKLALEKVVTDRYFRLAADTQDKLDEHKARTLSWALTYFLAHRKLDGLLRYYKELSKLPRDMEFDNTALLGCFARAFDLVEVNDPSKVNLVKFAQLANDWNGYINITPLELQEFIQKGSELKTTPTPGG